MDFYRGTEELGHIHLDGELHLATRPPLGDELIRTGMAQRFPYAKGWVMCRIASASDAARAEWLIRLAYDHLGGTPASELLVGGNPA